MLKKKIIKLTRITYYAAKARIVFTSKPLSTPGGKNPISITNKSMVIYQYSCCCKASYIGLTIRHLRKRIKDHVPKSVENFCFSKKKDDIMVKVLNAFKSLSIAEHLVSNSTCTNSYNLKLLKLLVMLSI